MPTTEFIEIAICDDCAMFYANGDTSGCTPEDEARVIAGADTVGGHVIVDCDDDCTEFSKSRCDACNTRYAGRRHKAWLDPR